MDNNIEKVDLGRVDWRSSREFFESLGEALDKLDDKDESYNFTWVGKRKCIIEAGAPINKILRPDMEASKDFDNTKNMLIVGDNLDALKLLQESYLGKIKMIYIDPPYNTGHDFVYHDNFTIKKSDYTDNCTDEDGNILISEDEYKENSEANGRFHSDWLSMIYPRLKLARNLLSDDGVILVSIDDNEQSNLKKICDEIFGDENVETMIWNKEAEGSSGTLKQVQRFRQIHEYIILAYKNRGSVDFIKIHEALKGRENELQTANLAVNQEKEKMNHPNYFTITNPSGEKFTRQWKWSKEEIDRLIKEDLVYWGSDGHKQPRLIIPTDERRTTYLLSILNYGGTTAGRKDFENLMGDKIEFSYPKPIILMKKLLGTTTDNDSICLDFFAGSGTTGHAVMDLNAEDGGRRQYICVQLNEKTDEKSEAKKAGYNTIDQITAERLRRAGEKIKSEHPEAHIDTGFRVFRVDGSNENEGIRKPLNQINQSDLFGAIDNVKKDRTPLDLLFGVIYASALPFDFKLEARKIGENTVYLYGYLDEGTGLVACFDDNLSEETLKEIAKLKALTAAFKDSSFTDSAAKINLSEHFRIICPDTKVKVL